MKTNGAFLRTSFDSRRQKKGGNEGSKSDGEQPNHVPPYWNTSSSSG